MAMEIGDKVKPKGIVFGS